MSLKQLKIYKKTNNIRLLEGKGKRRKRGGGGGGGREEHQFSSVLATQLISYLFVDNLSPMSLSLSLSLSLYLSIHRYHISSTQRDMGGLIKWDRTFKKKFKELDLEFFSIFISIRSIWKPETSMPTNKRSHEKRERKQKESGKTKAWVLNKM